MIQTPTPPQNPAPTPNTLPNVNPLTTPTPAQPGNNEMISNHQNRENIINEILSMGFERLAIEQALTAAYFNKERAIDYLINGIPQNILNDLSGKNIFEKLSKLEIIKNMKISY